MKCEVFNSYNLSRENEKFSLRAQFSMPARLAIPFSSGFCETLCNDSFVGFYLNLPLITFQIKQLEWALFILPLNVLLQDTFDF